MVADTALATGMDFDTGLREKYDQNQLEASDKIESLSATQLTGEIIPLRMPDEETDSKDFERDRTVDKTIHFAKDASKTPYTASEEIPVSSRGFVTAQPSFKFMEIIKIHFLSPILDVFDKLQPHAKSPDAAVYVNRILHTIRQMEDRSPQDPFLDILFALYDALAVNDNWADYTADQYRRAKTILEKYSARSTLNQKTIEKAIAELEVVGFDTTPFTFDLKTTEE